MNNVFQAVLWILAAVLLLLYMYRRRRKMYR